MFRYTTSVYSLEIPAGNTDGAKSLAAAKKELKEEAGITAESWKLIGKFQSTNGIMSEIAYVYLATNLKEVYTDQQAEEGILEVRKIPLKKALQMAVNGGITDAQSIVGLHYAQAALKR